MGPKPSAKRNHRVQGWPQEKKKKKTTRLWKRTNLSDKNRQNYKRQFFIEKHVLTGDFEHHLVHTCKNMWVRVGMKKMEGAESTTTLVVAVTNKRTMNRQGKSLPSELQSPRWLSSSSTRSTKAIRWNKFANIPTSCVSAGRSPSNASPANKTW